jgi:HK97 family phage portal protein
VGSDVIMGFFETILKRVKGLNPNLASYAPAIYTGGIILPEFDAQKYTQAYDTNADVYAIVSFLARKAASIPWYVYKTKSGTKAKVAMRRYKGLTQGIGHPGTFERALIERKAAYDENMIVDDSNLARLLSRPNNYQGQDQFFEQTFGMRFLTGEGIWWGNTGNIPDGQFSELLVMPSQYMDIVSDPNDLYGISGWVFSSGTGSIPMSKQDVMQWKSWNPNFDAVTRTHLRGVSPIKAAWNNYLMGVESSKAAAKLMKNGGAKGALVPKVINNQITQVSEQKAAEMQRAISDRVNNNDRYGQVALLQTPWEFLNFGMTSNEMALVDTMKFSLEQWCRVFGLPVVLFSAENMADNNYQNALRDLVTNTIVPMCAQLRDEINRYLVPRMGETGVFVDFDVMALPELQRDIEKMVTGLVRADWLTYDEKRIAMNYEPRGGAYDDAYISQGLIPIGDAALNMGGVEGGGTNNI